MGAKKEVFIYSGDVQFMSMSSTSYEAARGMYVVVRDSGNIVNGGGNSPFGARPALY